MNDYSWNLTPNDYIEHAATGKAHYSKNWDKAKQDAYNKAYYIKNKNRILARKQQLRAKQAGKELNYISNQASRIARDTANEISDAVNRDYAVTKFRNGVNDRIDAARDTAKNLSNRRTANRVRSGAENEFNDIQRTARRTASRTKSRVRNNIDLTRSRMNSGINSAKRNANNARYRAENEFNDIQRPASRTANRAKSRVNSGIDSARRTASNAARDTERRAKQAKNNLDAGIYSVQSDARNLKNKTRYKKDLAEINAKTTVRNAKYRANKLMNSAGNELNDLKSKTDRANKKLTNEINKKKRDRELKKLGVKSTKTIV
jgi:hypothetical protein